MKFTPDDDEDVIQDVFEFELETSSKPGCQTVVQKKRCSPSYYKSQAKKRLKKGIVIDVRQSNCAAEYFRQHSDPRGRRPTNCADKE